MKPGKGICPKCCGPLFVRRCYVCNPEKPPRVRVERKHKTETKLWLRKEETK